MTSAGSRTGVQRLYDNWFGTSSARGRATIAAISYRSYRRRHPTSSRATGSARAVERRWTPDEIDQILENHFAPCRNGYGRARDVHEEHHAVGRDPNPIRGRPR